MWPRLVAVGRSGGTRGLSPAACLDLVELCLTGGVEPTRALLPLNRQREVVGRVEDDLPVDVLGQVVPEERPCRPRPVLGNGDGRLAVTPPSSATYPNVNTP